MATRPIRELVNHIVTCEGKKGKAVDGLQALHTRLQNDIQATNDGEAKRRLQQDSWFLEGYMQTPAAALADCQSACKMIDRDPRKRRRNQ